MDIDFLLLQKMKCGDETAFDAFVRKHYGEILKYCSYHCPDPSNAEDLTQETFLRFFEKLPNYRYMGKTKNYLYTIAGNLCRDSHKRIRESLPGELALERQDCSRPPEADEVLDGLTVQAALDSLPAELKEVIVLYYFQDLKLAEIAKILKVGLPLVKYRIKQAKMHLERLLGGN